MSLTLCKSLPKKTIKDLLTKYEIALRWVSTSAQIPGSFWGEPEAGLIGKQVFVRDDTPVHSLLHEVAHYICMPPSRRERLHTNAGGGASEENAVCYLQILLARALSGYSSEVAMMDMDAWGYTFRLGSARAWFEADANDAINFLQYHAIIVGSGLSASLTGRLNAYEIRSEGYMSSTIV